MTAPLTRPTLAELWWALLAHLEALGVDDAPGQARALAVAAWTGRAAEVDGDDLERWDGDGPVGRPATPARTSPSPPSRRRELCGSGC